MSTTTTITLTDEVARRVATLAAAAEQPVEAFIERLLRGLADAALAETLPRRYSQTGSGRRARVE